MTRKVDIVSNGRDVYFNPAGNDDFSGKSVQTAVTSPQKAIEVVNALVPTPSILNPASINAAETGAYFSGITVPDNTAANCGFAAIVTSDPVSLTMKSTQLNSWGSLINNSNNGICALIDTQIRVALEVNTLTIGSDGGGFAPESTGNIGVEVKGVCDDIFIDARQVILKGVGAIGFKHSATSTTPISYKEVSGEFFNINQTMVQYNSLVGQQVDVTLGKVAPSSIAIKPTTGSCVIRVISGTLSVQASTIQAEDIIRVSVDGLLTLNSLAGIGNIILEEGANSIIEITFYVGVVAVAANARLIAIFELYVGNTVADGEVIYQSVGTYTGNLETTSTGRIALTGKDVVGDALNGGNMSLICDKFIGDITNNGTMYVVIGTHIGTVTNNGTINGIINGVRYGNWIVAAEDVTYDNTDSGLISDNVKEAIDELANLEVGIMFMTGNTTETVIAAANTYVDIAGTITAGANNNLFDFDGDDTLIYKGERPLKAAFDVSFFTKRASAAAGRVMKAALLINDVVEQEVEFTMTASIANASFVSVAPIVTDDEIKMQVQNTQDAANIIFTTFDFRILRA